MVPDFQLSLAIGKEGQNARLAARLTGWRIDIRSDAEVSADVPDGHGHVYVKDVANAWADVLQPPEWTQEKTERLRPLLHPSAGT